MSDRDLLLGTRSNLTGKVMSCEPNYNYTAGVMYVIGERISTGIRDYDTLRDFEPDGKNPLSPKTYDGIKAKYKNYDDIITGDGHVTSITRINADGTETPIRGAAHIDVENNSLVAIDMEAPLDQTFRYRVQMSNGVDETSGDCSLPTSIQYPTDPHCVPVLLSDPFHIGHMQWLNLLSIDTLSYPARRELMDVIGRGAPVAWSSTRSTARTTMRFLTRTLAERANLLSLFSPGRVLLLRNPDNAYPENNWYLSVGDVDEERVNPNHADPARRWEIEVAVVDRPTGILDIYEETAQGLRSNTSDAAVVRTVIRDPDKEAYGVGRYPTTKAATSSWGLR
jgi:hypothetical protein